MLKSYADFVNEITPEVLYHGLLGHGLFPEKLPPLFTSVPFFDYCRLNSIVSQNIGGGGRQYIFFESMRNINIPRQFGIPDPFAYQKLWEFLSSNWCKIRQHFVNQTENHTHKISRVHLRRLKNKSCLFEMNYKNILYDGDTETDLLLGKRYLVKADISNCFPSIYSHALPWALVGKDEAKKNRNKKSEWYNQLDLFTRNCKNGETYGLLIGPHASNLLAEIILTVIDNNLYKLNWRYIRNIDDFRCYVSNYEEGQEFLKNLEEELRYFNLLLNYKKTEIIKLPESTEKQWVRKLNTFPLFYHEVLDYKTVRGYFDMAVELMKNSNTNSAILNYVIKVVCHKKLSKNARVYTIKIVLHLAFIYQYLVPLLDKYLFSQFEVNIKDIDDFSNLLFHEAVKIYNWEAVIYAVYFSIKYNFNLKNITSDLIIKSNNCILMLVANIYFRQRKMINEIKVMKKHAKQISKHDFGQHWLFLYEVLPENDLKGEWKSMKKANISFILDEYNEFSD
jgi:hypothetical protein